MAESTLTKGGSNHPPTVLGLDLSLRKAGFCVIDPSTWVPGKSGTPNMIDSGRLTTTVLDGFDTLRLMKQQKQVRALIEKYNVKLICVEQFYFDDGESELLFALHQFIRVVFFEAGVTVIALGNGVLKHLAWPVLNNTIQSVEKPQMMARAKEVLGIRGKGMVDDVADAFWAMYAAVHFYHWHVSKKLKDKDLGEYLLKVFAGKHTYTRGEKKGTTEYTGVIYRENELFFDYTKIKERLAHGRHPEKETSSAVNSTGSGRKVKRAVG